MANKTKLEQNASQRKQFGVPLQMLQLTEDVTHGTAAEVRKVAGRFKRRELKGVASDVESVVLNAAPAKNFSKNLKIFSTF